MNRRVLLIGKLNTVLRNLNELLEKTFMIQLCADDINLVKGMNKIFKPDIVIISTSEMDSEKTEIFDYYYGAYRKKPVIVVSIPEEIENYKGYFENDQFSLLLRPVGKKQLITRCCEMMGVTEKEVEEVKDEMVKNAVSRRNSNSKDKIVMLVDDSAVALRSTKAMIDKKYKVLVATSGLKALEAMKKNKPDLVLLDYDMPKFDGKDTLEQMRQDEELKDIPVFFITAVADARNIAAVLKLSPNGYFLKPLEKEKILNAIAQYLDG